MTRRWTNCYDIHACVADLVYLVVEKIRYKILFLAELNHRKINLFKIRICETDNKNFKLINISFWDTITLYTTCCKTNEDKLIVKYIATVPK